MPKHLYSANFTNPFEESNKSTPGTFYFDKAFSRPSDEFVISRTIEERTLSKYGDDIWDLRPYRTVNYGGGPNLFLICRRCRKGRRKMAYVFVVIYSGFWTSYGAGDRHCNGLLENCSKVGSPFDENKDLYSRYP